MTKEFIHIKTGELITIVRIKIGEYELDYHKLVDTYGREWLPEQLVKEPGLSRKPAFTNEKEPAMT
jgi:hypothetical protein